MNEFFIQETTPELQPASPFSDTSSLQTSFFWGDLQVFILFFAEPVHVPRRPSNLSSLAVDWPEGCRLPLSSNHIFHIIKV